MIILIIELITPLIIPSHNSHHHAHHDDAHPMPEGFEPTVAVPWIAGQFQAEKLKICFAFLMFILLIVIVIVIIIFIVIVIVFTSLGFPVVGKLRDQVGVTGCLTDSAPSTSS